MKVWMAFVDGRDYWMYAAFSQDALLHKVWEHYRDNQQGGQEDPEFIVDFPTGQENRHLSEEEFYGLYLDDMILFDDAVRIMQGELVIEESNCCTNAAVVIKCKNCGKLYV
jgi:hypothetical protein